jgi:hypothetical protein
MTVPRDVAVAVGTRRWDRIRAMDTRALGIAAVLTVLDVCLTRRRVLLESRERRVAGGAARAGVARQTAALSGSPRAPRAARSIAVQDRPLRAYAVSPPIRCGHLCRGPESRPAQDALPDVGEHDVPVPTSRPPRPRREDVPRRAVQDTHSLDSRGHAPDLPARHRGTRRSHVDLRKRVLRRRGRTADSSGRPVGEHRNWNRRIHPRHGGRTGWDVAIYAGSVAFDVRLALWLCPRYGILGAAVANALTFACSNCAQLAAVKRFVDIPALRRTLRAPTRGLQRGHDVAGAPLRSKSASQEISSRPARPDGSCTRLPTRPSASPPRSAEWRAGSCSVGRGREPCHRLPGDARRDFPLWVAAADAISYPSAS